MDLMLSEKVILVAAASQGLGYGTALALAREGARVGICSRDAGRIEAAAARIREATGAEVVGAAVDLADPAQIADWVASAQAHFGRIDGLVTNAGGPPVGTFDTFDDAAWEAAYQRTLMSAVRLVRATLPALRVRGGSILMLTSVSVKEPIDNLLLSNVFRSGVTSLSKSLSRQLGPEGIRVNTLMPGRIATERIVQLDQATAEARGINVVEQQQRMEAAIPLGRYGTAEEFGRVAAFLLSDAAAYITGASLQADGGMLHTVW